MLSEPYHTVNHHHLHTFRRGTINASNGGMDMADGSEFPDRTWSRLRLEAMRRGLDPGMLAGLLLDQALDRIWPATIEGAKEIPEDCITSRNHREVAAVKLGRPLRRGEVVHHINGDHSDNRPENLAILKRSDHQAAHVGGWWRRHGKEILPP